MVLVEALRSLKRQVSGAVFTRLRADAQRGGRQSGRTRPGVGGQPHDTPSAGLPPQLRREVLAVGAASRLAIALARCLPFGWRSVIPGCLHLVPTPNASGVQPGRLLFGESHPRRMTCPTRLSRPARFAGSVFRTGHFSTCISAKTTWRETALRNRIATILMTPGHPGSARAAHPGAAAWHPASPAPPMRWFR